MDKTCRGCIRGGARRGASCPLNGKVPDGWLAGCNEYKAAGLGAVLPAASMATVANMPTKGTPNKTEAEYRMYHLRGLDARYEAITFRLANGHRYTPDWIVFEDGRPTQCHECKGSYALHSQQRAKLAFDQARVEFPGLRWVWAVKSADGWEVTPPLLGPPVGE